MSEPRTPPAQQPDAATPGAFIGEIRAFAIPANDQRSIDSLHRQGWAEADGASLNQLTYPKLCAVIGTSWGTVDANNVYNLPDLRGYFLRGWDGGSRHDPDAARRTVVHAGGATGAKVGTLENDAVQKHGHDNPPHAHAMPRYTGSRDGNSAFDQGENRYGGNLTGPETVKIGVPATIDTRRDRAVLVASETRPINVSVIYFVYMGQVFDPRHRIQG
jgi:microcystin-dependent protein